MPQQKHKTPANRQVVVSSAGWISPNPLQILKYASALLQGYKRQRLEAVGSRSGRREKGCTRTRASTRQAILSPIAGVYAIALLRITSCHAKAAQSRRRNRSDSAQIARRDHRSTASAYRSPCQWISPRIGMGLQGMLPTTSRRASRPNRGSRTGG